MFSPRGHVSEAQLRFWETRGLFSLDRNPYLLAALIYIYDHAPGGDLPRNAGTLFRMLVRALWNVKEVEWHNKVLSDTHSSLWHKERSAKALKRLQSGGTPANAAPASG
jgi:hypothetical protein